ncbi:hypothetical protein SBC2_66230 (plasmid) [Caballeronia sp. SBC2]|nr:hypothetical protein SBC2_66230 [Caballeronia sp. SBC2]
MPCGVPWQWCLPESVGGEACSCKDSREGGVHTFVALASSVLLGYHIRLACTLWTLTCLRFESVFFASFLCRFGQRNDAPPRAVANSDKENIRLTRTAKAESSNPALTPTANPRTWRPGNDPDPPAPKSPPKTPSTGASKPYWSSSCSRLTRASSSSRMSSISCITASRSTGVVSTST